MPDKPSIAIAVITFRRQQQLAATLQSLRNIALPEDVRVRLLVVDNDPGKSAELIVASAKDGCPFPVEYLTEEKRGIPHARNKALENATGNDYVAFIDDDDMADSQWLAALYSAARSYAADVVKGRVLYSFPSGKEYLGRIDLFAEVPVATGTELSSAWTNNVLFATKIYTQSGLRFDCSFTKTGGSDHHFFRCAKQSGAKIVMCSEAIIHTPVPQERTSWRWLARRNTRVGATLTISDIKAHGYAYAIRHAWLAFMDSLRYFFRLLPGVSSGHNRFVHPAMVFFFAIGRLAGIVRLSPAEYWGERMWRA